MEPFVLKTFSLRAIPSLLASCYPGNRWKQLSTPFDLSIFFAWNDWARWKAELLFETKLFIKIRPSKEYWSIRVGLDSQLTENSVRQEITRKGICQMRSFLPNHFSHYPDIALAHFQRILAIVNRFHQKKTSYRSRQCPFWRIKLAFFCGGKVVDDLNLNAR